MAEARPRVRRFKRGMTVLDRRLLREDVMVREIALAHKRAREYRLTPVCREAMAETGSHPVLARRLHGSCKGEDPAGTGCLCQCHDDDRILGSSVAFGLADTRPLSL